MSVIGLSHSTQDNIIAHGNNTQSYQKALLGKVYCTYKFEYITNLRDNHLDEFLPWKAPIDECRHRGQMMLS